MYTNIVFHNITLALYWHRLPMWYDSCPCVLLRQKLLTLFHVKFQLSTRFCSCHWKGAEQVSFCLGGWLSVTLSWEDTKKSM